MAFPHLYQHLLPLWGNPVTFADGAFLEHKNPFLALGKLKGQQNPTARSEHFFSQEFSNSWLQAEKQLSPDQLLEKQVLWAMYQVFHAHAEALFRKGITSFSPAELPHATVEARLLKNLHEPGYEAELALYRNLPS